MIEFETLFNSDTSHCDIFDSCDEWDSFPSSPILSACKDKRLRCSARTSILTLDDQILQGEDGAKSPSLLEKNHPFFNRFSVKKKIVSIKLLLSVRTDITY